MNSPEPEIFFKDKFCKAVTGYTDKELRDMVTRRYVDPADNVLETSIGHDMPRDGADQVADKYMIFMGAQYQLSLLDLPVESLYESFAKFRRWEEYVHPRPRFYDHEKYWGPTYRRIEEAFQARDEQAVKDGIVDLVDQILHD